MKRLRTLRFRSYVLPVILAALAARALMPSGFMTMSGNGPAITTQLCSLERDRRAPLELPAEKHGLQCDHCLSPMGFAPIALALRPLRVEMAPLLVSIQPAQFAFAPLRRAQAARAPPQA